MARFRLTLLLPALALASAGCLGRATLVQPAGMQPGPAAAATAAIEEPTLLEGVATLQGKALPNAPVGMVDARTGQAAGIIAVGAGHVIAMGAGHLTGPAGIIAVGAGHYALAQANDAPVFRTDAQGRFSVPVSGLTAGLSARLTVQNGAGSALATTLAGTPSGIIAVGAGHVIAMGAGHLTGPAGVVAVGAGHYALRQADAEGLEVNEGTTLMSHVANAPLRLTGTLKPAAAAQAVEKLVDALSQTLPDAQRHYAGNPAETSRLLAATAADGGPRDTAAVNGAIAASGVGAQARTIAIAALQQLAAAASEPANRDGTAPATPATVPVLGTSLNLKLGGEAVTVTGANGATQPLASLAAPGAAAALNGTSGSSGSSGSGGSNGPNGANGAGDPTPPPPNVSGHVYDEGGNGVAGVTVTAMSATSEALGLATTDASGAYAMSLPAIEALTILKAEKTGLTVIQGFTPVSPGSTLARDFGGGSDAQQGAAFLPAHPVVIGLDPVLGSGDATTGFRLRFGGGHLDAVALDQLGGSLRISPALSPPLGDAASLTTLPSLLWQQGSTDTYHPTAGPLQVTANAAAQTLEASFPAPLAGGSYQIFFASSGVPVLDAQAQPFGGLQNGQGNTSSFNWLPAPPGQLLAGTFRVNVLPFTRAFPAAYALPETRWLDGTLNGLTCLTQPPLTPPVLVSATRSGPSQLTVQFSGPFLTWMQAGAVAQEQKANYIVKDDANHTGTPLLATLQPPATVLLDVTGSVPGTPTSLTFQGVTVPIP